MKITPYQRPALHNITHLRQHVLASSDHQVGWVVLFRTALNSVCEYHYKQIFLCRIDTGQDTGWPVLEAICKAADALTIDELTVRAVSFLSNPKAGTSAA